MYRNCIWCSADLGENESIEHFPIGRRLAFDAAKGWLWVVCRKCDRWNLTPIEERWEAIEECEKRFRDSKLRVSTDEIGLVRIDNGLDLIRIGSPLRPEFAVWRYGDRFARRRRQALAIGGATVVAGGTVAVLPGILPFFDSGHLATPWLTAFVALMNTVTAYRSIPRYMTSYYRHWATARLSIPGYEHPVRIRGEDLGRVAIAREGSDWRLFLSFKRSRKESQENWRTRKELRGQDALSAAAKILPTLNARGGKEETVKTAVKLIDERPDVSALFQKFATAPGQSYYAYMKERRTQLSGAYAIHHAVDDERAKDDRAVAEQALFRSGSSTSTMEHGAPMSTLPDAARLALEMATHESAERRAMEGELALLTLAWKEAAEIASSSDAMFLPEGILERVQRLKGSNSGMTPSA